MSEYPHTGIILEYVHFFHWYTAERLGEHIWKSCRKLYIKLIVINFCRCPTLAYITAMYTGMFVPFIEQNRTEDNFS